MAPLFLLENRMKEPEYVPKSQKPAMEGGHVCDCAWVEPMRNMPEKMHAEYKSSNDGKHTKTRGWMDDYPNFSYMD